MKRTFSTFMIVVLLFSLGGCSVSPKIYNPPEGITMSVTEIVELLYDRHSLQESCGTVPASVAVSLKEPAESPLIFAFIPEEMRLVLVVEDIYYVPESEWEVVGRNLVERVAVLTLDVPYRSLSELLAQDAWYGSVMEICPLSVLPHLQKLHGAFYLEEPLDDGAISDFKGTAYGLYYPGREAAVRFPENPLDSSSSVPTVGYYVVSGDTVSAAFREELFPCKVLPEE